MEYHWEWLDTNQVALFEEGATWKGMLGKLRIGVAINEMGPYMGNPKVTYRASGPLVDPFQDFDSFDEAMRAVEIVAMAAGHTIEGD